MFNLIRNVRLPAISARRENTRSGRFSTSGRWIVLLVLAICLLCIPASMMAQTQLGSDIDGEAAWDHSGSAVSLSANGKRLAVGAPRNSDSAAEAGQVRVFQWSGSDWIQMGSDIDGDVAMDLLGQSVSISGDGMRVAIGAPGNDSNGETSGQVRVFEWSGADWSQLGSDIIGAAGDQLGVGVSLSADGSRLALSAPENVATIRIYQWSGMQWEQLGAQIEAENGSTDRLGSVSLSADGNRVALGAGSAADNRGAGNARVFGWTGDAWIQLGSNIAGEAPSDRFGEAVSLSGDGNRLAVGAVSNDDGGYFAGHVRVYRWSGSDWVQLGQDIDGEVKEIFFGNSVSLSADGNRLAAAASSYGEGGIYQGRVYLYSWSGTAWVPLGNVLDGEAPYDGFGHSVSLSSNGSRLAAGAPQNDDNGDRSGHVRVFDLGMFDPFEINAGLNDAWYYKPTDGQGFFITVFPDLGYVSLAWFTYDTELPGEGATANLGDPGHRWLTALGPIDGDRSVMNITMTSGGIFDTATEIKRTDPVGSDGTLTLIFDSCSAGTVEYDIPPVNRHGVIPIERVADDNIVLCEALRTE